MNIESPKGPDLATGVAILDTETDSGLLPQIPSLHRLQTQPISSDRHEVSG